MLDLGVDDEEEVRLLDNGSAQEWRRHQGVDEAVCRRHVALCDVVGIMGFGGQPERVRITAESKVVV